MVNSKRGAPPRTVWPASAKRLSTRPSVSAATRLERMGRMRPTKERSSTSGCSRTSATMTGVGGRLLAAERTGQQSQEQEEDTEHLISLAE